MSAADGIVFPLEVTVRAWEVDRGMPAFPTQHQYVEMPWLPVIGPSTTGCCAVSAAGLWRALTVSPSCCRS